MSLTPGWTGFFLAYAMEEGQQVALPGCDVLVDGQWIGQTGEDGTLEWHAQAAPSKVAIRRDDKRLAESNCLDDEGLLMNPFKDSGSWLAFELTEVD